MPFLASLTKVKEIKVGIGFGAFSVDKNLRLGLYVNSKDKISISGFLSSGKELL